MFLTLSDRQTRFLRLKAQRLTPSEAGYLKSPAQVLDVVAGVQAQDLPAARLSMRARSAGITADQVDQARQADPRRSGGGSIARIWCMRGTLHLVSAPDALWLVPLLGPGWIASDRRRMQQLGWDEELTLQGLHLLQQTLSAREDLVRPEITRLLKDHNLPSEGQAPYHLLFRAAMEGILCDGPDRGKTPTYALFERWLGPLQPLPRPIALEKLALRYLDAYGPSTATDLAFWSGLKARDAREAWEAVMDQLIQVEVSGKPAWLLKSHLAWLDAPVDPTPVVRLLPRYDTFWMGYASRDLWVDPATLKRILPGGGIIHATLIIDGIAVGTWSTQRRGAVLEVQVDPFESLEERIIPQIEAEVEDLARFLGVEAILKIRT